MVQESGTIKRAPHVRENNDKGLRRTPVREESHGSGLRVSLRVQPRTQIVGFLGQNTTDIADIVVFGPQSPIIWVLGP